MRNGIEGDAQAVLDNFNLTHEETDYLLTYPNENCFDVMRERQFQKEKSESEHEIEIVALIGNVIVGTAGIAAMGKKYKIRHRAELGVSVAKEFWGLGIGQALTAECIEYAKAAGYIQLELTVVAGNARALAIYKKPDLLSMAEISKTFILDWQDSRKLFL